MATKNWIHPRGSPDLFVLRASLLRWSYFRRAGQTFEKGKLTTAAAMHFGSGLDGFGSAKGPDCNLRIFVGHADLYDVRPDAWKLRHTAGSRSVALRFEETVRSVAMFSGADIRCKVIKHLLPTIHHGCLKCVETGTTIHSPRQSHSHKLWVNAACGTACETACQLRCQLWIGRLMMRGRLGEMFEPFCVSMHFYANFCHDRAQDLDRLTPEQNALMSGFVALITAAACNLRTAWASTAEPVSRFGSTMNFYEYFDIL